MSVACGLRSRVEEATTNRLAAPRRPCRWAALVATACVLGLVVTAAQAGPASATGQAFAAWRTEPVTAYVADTGPDAVIPIRTDTDKVLKPIKVGSLPYAVAITPDGRTAYVVSNGSELVTPISTATNKALAPVSIGGTGAQYIAITPNGLTVYVVTIGCPCPEDVLPTLTAISAATNRRLKTITLPGSPGSIGGIAVAPGGRTAYILDTDQILTVRTATSTLGAPINLDTRVPADASAITFAPDGRLAYVADLNSSTVSVISTVTNKLVRTINVGLGPASIAIAPDGRALYVVNALADTVSVISTATNAVVKTIRVGSFPCCLAITPDGRTAFLINQLSGTVSAISTATDTVIKTITASDASQIAITPNGKTAYVTTADGTVIPIDTASNMARPAIRIGGLPLAIAITPARQRQCRRLRVRR
jgi:YVTN family beta-propeller protein